MNKRHKGFDQTLWSIMCDWFDMNWTNPFIKSLYQDGVTLNIIHYDDLTISKHFFPGHLLTDRFLNDARMEYQRQKRERNDH